MYLSQSCSKPKFRTFLANLSRISDSSYAHKMFHVEQFASGDSNPRRLEGRKAALAELKPILYPET